MKCACATASGPRSRSAAWSAMYERISPAQEPGGRLLGSRAPGVHPAHEREQALRDRDVAHAERRVVEAPRDLGEQPSHDPAERQRRRRLRVEAIGVRAQQVLGAVDVQQLERRQRVDDVRTRGLPGDELAGADDDRPAVLLDAAAAPQLEADLQPLRIAGRDERRRPVDRRRVSCDAEDRERPERVARRPAAEAVPASRRDPHGLEHPRGLLGPQAEALLGWHDPCVDDDAHGRQLSDRERTGRGGQRADRSGTCRAPLRGASAYADRPSRVRRRPARRPGRRAARCAGFGAPQPPAVRCVRLLGARELVQALLLRPGLPCRRRHRHGPACPWSALRRWIATRGARRWSARLRRPR